MGEDEVVGGEIYLQCWRLSVAASRDMLRKKGSFLTFSMKERRIVCTVEILLNEPLYVL